MAGRKSFGALKQLEKAEPANLIFKDIAEIEVEYFSNMHLKELPYLKYQLFLRSAVLQNHKYFLRRKKNFQRPQGRLGGGSGIRGMRFCIEWGGVNPLRPALVKFKN